MLKRHLKHTGLDLCKDVSSVNFIRVRLPPLAFNLGQSKRFLQPAGRYFYARPQVGHVDEGEHALVHLRLVAEEVDHRAVEGGTAVARDGLLLPELLAPLSEMRY